MSEHGTWGRNSKKKKGATERGHEQKRTMTALMKIGERVHREETSMGLCPEARRHTAQRLS